ncbi:MAG: hypothetical protein JWM71_2292 [Solirubrobacteraceae bacterium]|nr:hypothetical protein [Solirubrobacteraceae bacterium]
MRRTVMAVLVGAVALTGAFLLGGATHASQKAQAAGFAPMRVVRTADGEVASVVGVTIGKRTFPFIVDTGAASTVIDIRAARKAGLLKPIGHSYKVAGVGGKARAVPIVLKSWAVGPVPLPSLRIDATNLRQAAGGGPVGLLGSDVLSRFRSVTLDFRGRRLQLGR